MIHVSNRMDYERNREEAEARDRSEQSISGS